MSKRRSSDDIFPSSDSKKRLRQEDDETAETDESESSLQSSGQSSIQSSILSFGQSSGKSSGQSSRKSSGQSSGQSPSYSTESNTENCDVLRPHVDVICENARSSPAVQQTPTPLASPPLRDSRTPSFATADPSENESSHRSSKDAETSSSSRQQEVTSPETTSSTRFDSSDKSTNEKPSPLEEHNSSVTSVTPSSVPGEELHSSVVPSVLTASPPTATSIVVTVSSPPEEPSPEKRITFLGCLDDKLDESNKPLSLSEPDKEKHSENGQSGRGENEANRSQGQVFERGDNGGKCSSASDEDSERSKDTRERCSSDSADDEDSEPTKEDGRKKRFSKQVCEN